MMLNKLKAYAVYYGKAAAHTFWQAALASLAAFFGGSGLDIAHLPSVGVLEKVAAAAALAGAAAVMSYIKQLIVLPAPGSVGAVETTDATPASLLAASAVPAVKNVHVPDTGVKERPMPNPPAA